MFLLRCSQQLMLNISLCNWACWELRLSQRQLHIVGFRVMTPCRSCYNSFRYDTLQVVG